MPYWDAGAPGLSLLDGWRDKPADPFNHREPVDSSAAAIACQGLLRLGHVLTKRSAPADGDRYTQAGLRVLDTLCDEPYLAVDAGPKTEWWTDFGSSSLDNVVGLALADNQDVAAAKARVAEAQEAVTSATGALLPQLSLNAGAGAERYGASTFGPLNFTVPPFVYYQAGPTATFSIAVSSSSSGGTLSPLEVLSGCDALHPSR